MIREMIQELGERKKIPWGIAVSAFFVFLFLWAATLGGGSFTPVSIAVIVAFAISGCISSLFFLVGPRKYGLSMKRIVGTWVGIHFLSFGFHAVFLLAVFMSIAVLERAQ